MRPSVSCVSNVTHNSPLALQYQYMTEIKAPYTSQVIEYYLEMNNRNIDIGDQLNSLKQTEYKEIHIRLHDGVYIWEKSVYVFDNCFIKLYAENREKVTIFMKDPTVHRLIMDGRNSTVEISGIDIYESIATPHSTDMFDISGHNMTFSILNGTLRLCSSPFICLKKAGLKTVILDNLNIVKDISAQNNVTVASVDPSGGAKGFVCCKNVNIGEGVFLGRESKNLEILD